MTNSEKAALVQQYSGPNHERIRSLMDEGYGRQQAEEIDSLERRECVLNELGAAGELTDAQRDELDTVQSQLLELVGSPHATYVGTSFPEHAGDGAPAGTEPAPDVEDETSVEGTRAMMNERRAQMSMCAAFLMDHKRTGSDAPLRIAMRHAEKAETLEDRIDAALTGA